MCRTTVNDNRIEHHHVTEFFSNSTVIQRLRYLSVVIPVTYATKLQPNSRHTSFPPLSVICSDVWGRCALSTAIGIVCIQGRFTKAQKRNFFNTMKAQKSYYVSATAIIIENRNNAKTWYAQCTVYQTRISWRTSSFLVASYISATL